MIFASHCPSSKLEPNRHLSFPQDHLRCISIWNSKFIYILYIYFEDLNLVLILIIYLAVITFLFSISQFLSISSLLPIYFMKTYGHTHISTVLNKLIKIKLHIWEVKNKDSWWNHIKFHIAIKSSREVWFLFSMWWNRK